MDLFIYLIVMICMGFIKMKAPVDTVSPLIADPGEQVADMCTLPIGRNLSLLREKDAFTLILEELGLK